MKRLNPLTGLPFVKGDVRDDGFIFNQYFTQKLRQNGTFEESWLAPTTYFRERVRVCMAHAKKRAAEDSFPFDIDVAYLLAIYPKDSLCPVLKTPMVFGGDRWTSPSLDRLEPSKGYVRGNLC